MTVPRRAKAKRSYVEEVTRVAIIFNLLAEWADTTWPVQTRERISPDHFLTLLGVAERIAARTED